MIDIAAVHLPSFHPLHLLHFFLLSLSSFLFYSLVSIFCPCRQFCTAIRRVREDAISGKTSGSIFSIRLYQCVNLTFALFSRPFISHNSGCASSFTFSFHNSSMNHIFVQHYYRFNAVNDLFTCPDSFTKNTQNNGECDLFKRSLGNNKCACTRWNVYIIKQGYIISIVVVWSNSFL